MAKLKQCFLEINSYVTASVLLQATGIVLNEEEYKIAEIFFFQSKRKKTKRSKGEGIQLKV